MPAPISVIIPTLNSASELSACLSTVMEGVEAGLICELIVVDGGSTDDTCAIAAEWGADVVKVSASRGGQLRAGGAAAKGDYLLFLHSDTRLEAGWTDAIARQLGQGPACFKLSFRAKGIMARITAGWANLRTRLFGLPYGDQGLFIARDIYHSVGGYLDQPLMEDVAMAQALKRDRHSIVLLPAIAATGAEKYESQGWITRGVRNIILLLRYLLGASPASLAKKYPRRSFDA